MLTFAVLALVPAVASAQTGSPPAVAGVVVERPAAPVVLGETLPRTGSELVPMLVVAGALLLLGTMLVVSVRRRRGPVTTA